jgi:hypothetical protein
MQQWPDPETAPPQQPIQTPPGEAPHAPEAPTQTPEPADTPNAPDRED